MNVHELRKNKIEANTKKQKEIVRFQNEIKKKLKLNDKIRLSIFDYFYLNDLIENGYSILGFADKPYRIEIAHTRWSCFPFNKINSKMLLKAFPDGKIDDKSCEWEIGKTVYRYNELLSIESLILSEKESKNVLDIGIKKYDCEIKIEDRTTWLGSVAKAKMLYLKEEKC